jgi:hypothetical protein
MEYINLFLILLTMMLLSVTSYEHFFQCKKDWQRIAVDDTQSVNGSSSAGSSSSANSVKYTCCPNDNKKLEIKYEYVAGTCCKNKISKVDWELTQQKTNKDKKQQKLYSKHQPLNKTQFYCGK